MSIKPFSITFFSLALLVFLQSCHKERFSGIETQNVSVQLVRFEDQLFNTNLYTFQDSLSSFIKKYPQFMALYGSKVLEIGVPSQSWFNDALFSFRTDQAIYNIYKEVNGAHMNFSKTLQQINNAFGKWKTIFPKKNIPDIYTYVSGFNQSIVTTDSLLGISLEKYLGKDEELYNQVYPPIPAYQRYNMTPERIPIDIVRAWATTQIDYKPEQDNLISRMIYNGQVLFLTSKLLPHTPDTLLLGFTPDQMDFCTEQEANMWTYLIEQQLLFNTDKFRIDQFTHDAPYTKDFDKDSPGKAAVWIGYRIIEQYADKKRDLSLSDIVTNNNYQAILNESGYRPI